MSEICSRSYIVRTAIDVYGTYVSFTVVVELRGNRAKVQRDLIHINECYQHGDLRNGADLKQCDTQRQHDWVQAIACLMVMDKGQNAIESALFRNLRMR